MSKRSSAITDAEVQEALSSLGTIDGDRREVAIRSLNGGNVPVDEDSIRMYLALAQLMRRVKPDLVQRWTKKHIVRSVSRKEY